MTEPDGSRVDVSHAGPAIAVHIVQPNVLWLVKNRFQIPATICDALRLNDHGEQLPTIRTVLTTFETACTVFEDNKPFAYQRALPIAQQGSELGCSECDALLLYICWHLQLITPEKALQTATLNKQTNNIWMFVWGVIQLTISRYDTFLRGTCWRAMLPAADAGFLLAQLQLMSDLRDHDFDFEYSIWYEKYMKAAARNGHYRAMHDLALFYDNQSKTNTSLMGWWWWIACAQCHPNPEIAANILQKIGGRRITLVRQHKPYNQ
jgi:hypothetical protein